MPKLKLVDSKISYLAAQLVNKEVVVKFIWGDQIWKIA